MAAFSEEFISENDFEAVLATFCRYEYGYVYCHNLLKRQLTFILDNMVVLTI